MRNLRLTRVQLGNEENDVVDSRNWMLGHKVFLKLCDTVFR